MTCFQTAFQKSEKGNKKTTQVPMEYILCCYWFLSFSLTFLLDGLCYVKMQGPKLCAHV